MKGKQKAENFGNKGKRRQNNSPETKTPNWQSTFEERWEQSIEQDNARLNIPQKCFMEPKARK